MEAEESNRPLIVGERTNVIGSRLFKNLVAEEKWEEATEIARRQVKNGAHIIDVCLQTTDRDEIKDIPPFYEKLIRKIKAPDHDRHHRSARRSNWRSPTARARASSTRSTWKTAKRSSSASVRSPRLTARRWSSARIDEDKLQAQAFTRERKLAVAQRSVELLTEKYGIAPEDIIIDPLVFPCATGDENYIGGAVETIEAHPADQGEHPVRQDGAGDFQHLASACPPRRAKWSTRSSSTTAPRPGSIWPSSTRRSWSASRRIPEDERRLAENLLFNTPPADARRRIAAHRARRLARSRRANRRPPSISSTSRRSPNISARPARASRQHADDLPLDQRLANYIIEGTKDGLIADLDRKRAEGAAPLDIINGPLMAGMTEVGRLFNNNELIVAEVLQSAEAMKAAVNHLEQFMEKADTAARGKIILATVKGDVHDIGKNLVEIILGNNGYEVINLGIKVPPDDLIQACQRASSRTPSASPGCW